MGKITCEIIQNGLAHSLAGFYGSAGHVGLKQNILERKKRCRDMGLVFKHIQSGPGDNMIL